MAKLMPYTLCLMKNTLLALTALLILASCTVFEDPKERKLEEHEELMEKFDSIDAPTMDKELYRSAISAVKNGDFYSADQYYQQLIKNSPNNPKYKMDYAMLSRKMGRCDLSMQIYNDLEATKAKINPLDIKEEKALCQLSQGEFQKAGEAFTEVINADSSRWKSINGAGLIFATKKKFNEANQYLDLAADVSNGNPAVLNNQGLVKAIIGNYDDAIEVLKTASIRAKEDAEQKRRVDLNLAMVYGISGQVELAEAVAKPHLAEPQLFNNLGVYAELSKQPQLAKTYLNKALTGAPIHYERAWDNLERVGGK